MEHNHRDHFCGWTTRGVIRLQNAETCNETCTKPRLNHEIIFVHTQWKTRVRLGRTISYKSLRWCFVYRDALPVYCHRKRGAYSVSDWLLLSPGPDLLLEVTERSKVQRGSWTVKHAILTGISSGVKKRTPLSQSTLLAGGSAGDSKPPASFSCLLPFLPLSIPKY